MDVNIINHMVEAAGGKGIAFQNNSNGVVNEESPRSNGSYQQGS